MGAAPDAAPAPGTDPAADPSAPAAGARPLTAPPAPGEGRVWRRPGGIAQPASVPGTTAPGAPQAGTRRAAPVPGLGRFLGLAAAAVALLAAGAALGGPLGLVPAPAPAPSVAPGAAAAPLLGAAADLLELPGQLTVPFTDAAGEPAGAVILAPGSGRLIAVTRALPPGADAWVVVLERDGMRTRIGPLERAADPDAGGAVAWWIGPLPETLPVDAGRAGDRILVLPTEGIGGTPLLDARF